MVKMALEERIMSSTRKRTSAERSLLSERINKLVNALSDGVYEREDTIKLCLLAALSGESVFLLGPPGIAKSLIAKRLIQAFESNSYFEYLMTRFSTPEEVFGPLSIQELKDNGRYVRLTDGYLPSSQVVFLDEIWKAGPAILNTLLTVVNEKTFKNGSDVEPVPMRLLIAASNELPNKDSGLDALYDRLLIRVFVNRIQNKQNFHSMLTIGTPQEAQVPEELAVKDAEYHQWLNELDQLELSESTFEQLYYLKSQIEAKEQADSTTIAESDLYVSDRRWKKAVKLLKASAYFNGRDSINALDLLLLQDCLWSSPQSRLIVRECLLEFATNQAYHQGSLRTQIEEKQNQLDESTEVMIQNLAITLSSEVEGTLRRKNIYQYDLSKAKRYRIGTTSDLVKLVLLQTNISVTDDDIDDDSRWVYIPYKEIEQIVKDGGGDAYGFVNRKNNFYRFQFDVDVEQRLVIKDIGNRGVPVTLATEKGPDQKRLSQWQSTTKSIVKELTNLEFDVLKARNEFHANLPHNFLDKAFLLKIESSIQELSQLTDSIKQKTDEAMQHIQRLQEAFE